MARCPRSFAEGHATRRAVARRPEFQSWAAVGTFRAEPAPQRVGCLTAEFGSPPWTIFDTGCDWAYRPAKGVKIARGTECWAGAARSRPAMEPALACVNARAGAWPHREYATPNAPTRPSLTMHFEAGPDWPDVMLYAITPDRWAAHGSTARARKPARPPRWVLKGKYTHRCSIDTSAASMITSRLQITLHRDQHRRQTSLIDRIGADGRSGAARVLDGRGRPRPAPGVGGTASDPRRWALVYRPVRPVVAGVSGRTPSMASGVPDIHS
jgi:hypothetical protein